jgi:hypothetical protein
MRLIMIDKKEHIFFLKNTNIMHFEKKNVTCYTETFENLYCLRQRELRDGKQKRNIIKL